MASPLALPLPLAAPAHLQKRAWTPAALGVGKAPKVPSDYDSAEGVPLQLTQKPIQTSRAGPGPGPGPGGTRLCSSGPCCQTPSVGSARPLDHSPSAALPCAEVAVPYSFVLLPPWRNPALVHAPTNLICPLFLFCMRFSLTLSFFFLIKCWETELACGFVLGAGGSRWGNCQTLLELDAIYGRKGDSLWGS